MAKPRGTFAPIPVTVLTGFLGSGKTTLLNHILESPDHKMRFAIIENEFGEVGVDENIIQEAATEQIIEVMNGCICCTVRGDLSAALKKLRDRVADFDGIIIETTGLADPAPVAQTFFVDDDIKDFYTLDGIITVVDAMHILERLREEKPEGVENESVEQVAFADRILLNKCDLVAEEVLDEVTTALKGINASVKIIRCALAAPKKKKKKKYGMIAPSELINIKAFTLDNVLQMDPGFLNTDGEHQHDTSVSSVSVRFYGELNHLQLKMWLNDIQSEQAKDLFRYKGVLAVKGMPYKFVFQGVHMILNGSFQPKFRWKANERRECRLVFIGRDLNRAALEEGVMKCKVTDDELRFNIGEVVEASCEKFERGRVIGHWDEGNCYRVKLDNGKEVWAPMDIDEFIRKPEGASGSSSCKPPKNHTWEE